MCFNSDKLIYFAKESSFIISSIALFAAQVSGVDPEILKGGVHLRANLEL